MSIGIVTCAVLPEPDPDQDLLMAALGAAGARARLVAWDGEQADLPRNLVLRSCWDYPERPAEFLTWLDQANKRSSILNPPDVVRWNHHKRYLLDLEREGIPIVPTQFVNRGEAVTKLPCWPDLVIKPAISAGSWLTQRFTDSQDQALKFLAQMTQERDAMIQPFLPSVYTHGERSLVWIDGKVTHGVLKYPRFAHDAESVSEAFTPTPADLEFAAQVMRGREHLLYARVDVMINPQGQLVLSELELIEPSLFFKQSPSALEAFVAAIKELLPSSGKTP